MDSSIVLTKDQAARSFGIEIPKNCPYPDLWGCQFGMVIRGEPVNVGDLVMFKDGSARRLAPEDNKEDIEGVFHTLYAQTPKRSKLADLSKYDTAQISPNEQVPIGRITLFRSGRFGRVKTERDQQKAIGRIVGLIHTIDPDSQLRHAALVAS